MDGFRFLRAAPAILRVRGETPVGGFDGTLPGPLLRARRGDELKIRLSNDLGTPMTVHWHGIRGPNGMDGIGGFTQSWVRVGETFDYRIPLRDAGTFWYRGISAESRVPYGPLIVDEQNPPQVDRDVILMLDDWRQREDGAIDETGGAPLLTVNSTATFNIPTNTNERLRLRLINAGVRLLTLRVESHEPRVMAIDGQPAQPFLAKNGQVALAPGNRIDLFVDAGLPPGSNAPIFADNEGTEVVLARLVYGAAPVRAEPLPPLDPLPGNPLPEKIDLASSVKVEAAIEGSSGSFADQPFPEARAGTPPLFTVKRGRPVTVGFVNRQPSPQVIHVHGHAMRLLDRLDDGWKPFWLDTLLVGAGATTRTAFLADNPGKWLVESRALGARGPGRAAWFEVT